MASYTEFWENNCFVPVSPGLINDKFSLKTTLSAAAWSRESLEKLRNLI